MIAVIPCAPFLKSMKQPVELFGCFALLRAFQFHFKYKWKRKQDKKWTQMNGNGRRRRKSNAREKGKARWNTKANNNKQQKQQQHQHHHQQTTKHQHFRGSSGEASATSAARTYKRILPRNWGKKVFHLTACLFSLKQFERTMTRKPKVLLITAYKSDTRSSPSLRVCVLEIDSNDFHCSRSEFSYWMCKIPVIYSFTMVPKNRSPNQRAKRPRNKTRK